MSNPSPEKAPVLLKSEQAKEDPRGAHTSEQQAEERCRDDVHQGRVEPKQTEQKKSPQQKESTVSEENKEKPIIKGGITTNVLINPGDGKEVTKVPPGYHKIEDSAQPKSGTPYPEAQPSYDAAGNLNHIDIMPDKNRRDKNNR